MEQESKVSILIKAFFVRIANIIANPAKEWQVIRSENPSHTSVFIYALLLSIIPSICIYCREAFIGDSSYPEGNPMYGIQLGVYSFFLSIIFIYLLAWFLDFRAPAFESDKNFTKSLQLVVYSFTPYWLLGVAYIFGKGFMFIQMILGLYSIYLIYLGLPALKDTKSKKIIGFIINIGIVFIVLQLLLRTVSAYLPDFPSFQQPSKENWDGNYEYTNKAGVNYVLIVDANVMNKNFYELRYIGKGPGTNFSAKCIGKVEDDEFVIYYKNILEDADEGFVPPPNTDVPIIKLYYNNGELYTEGYNSSDKEVDKGPKLLFKKTKYD